MIGRDTTIPQNPPNIPPANTANIFTRAGNWLVLPYTLGPIIYPSIAGHTIHTINVKSHLYCIPISYYDLQNKTYKEIQEYAKSDRGREDIYYGRTLLDISDFDKKIEKDYNVDFSYGIINESNSDLNYKPDCICSFLSNPDLGYAERRDVIIFFRDMGCSEEEVIKILEEHLSSEKFHHCMFEEKQVTRLFNKDMLIMRSCYTLKSLGLCPNEKCSGNNLYI